MNHKPLIITRLSELVDLTSNFEDEVTGETRPLRMGEVLYDILRLVDTPTGAIQELRNVEDKAIHNAVDRAIKLEQDYNEKHGINQG